MKICSTCKEFKELEAFCKDKSSKDGHCEQCRICRSISAKRAYYKDPVRKSIQVKRWRELHPDYNKVYKNSPKYKYSNLVNSANQRNYIWELSFEEFMLFWQKPCIYGGHEIKTIGLDRVDNTKGYSIDNCVPCCTTCNRAKLKMGLEQFLIWIGQTYQYLEKTGVFQTRTVKFL
jgi:hypothetical protein